MPELDAGADARDVNNPDGFTDFYATAHCQSGLCKTVPWCADRQLGRWVCDLEGGTPRSMCPLGGDGRPQCPLGSSRAAPVPIIDRDGVSRTLYCIGPASETSFCERGHAPLINILAGIPAVANWQYCFVNPNEFGRRTGQRVIASFDYAAQCGSDRDLANDCSLDRAPIAHPDLSWARGFRCRKPVIESTRRFCVAGVNRAEVIANARRNAGAYCNLWSNSEFIGGAPGGGRSPGWVSFARESVRSGREPCVTVETTATCLAPGSYDPGVSDLGSEYAIVPGAASEVTFSPMTPAGPRTAPTLARVPIQGTAAADVVAGQLAITDLAMQASAGSFPPGFVRSGFSNLDGTWLGQPAAPTGSWTLDSSTIRIQSQVVTVSGLFARLHTAAPGARAIAEGNDLVLSARFPDTEFRVNIDLRLRLRATTVRPTAEITSVAPVGDIECTSPAGANVTLAGRVFVAGESAPSFNWLVPSREGGIVVNDSLTPTVPVPLLGRDDPGVTLSLFVFGSRATASDFRTVRVVDTVPPLVAGTQIDIPCGWIERESNPPVCLRVLASATDQCSSAIGVQVASVAAHDVLTGELLREEAQPACIQRLNGFSSVEEGLSRVVYTLRWIARDDWGNPSRVRRVMFTAGLVPVRPGDPPPRCAGGDVAANILDDVDE